MEHIKLFQFDKKIWTNGETSYTWQIGITHGKSLVWVNFEHPGGIVHSAGGFNILLSFFGSSLLSINILQHKFSFAFAFFVDYFEGWSDQ